LINHLYFKHSTVFICLSFDATVIKASCCSAVYLLKEMGNSVFD